MRNELRFYLWERAASNVQQRQSVYDADERAVFSEESLKTRKDFSILVNITHSHKLVLSEIVILTMVLVQGFGDLNFFLLPLFEPITNHPIMVVFNM